MHDTFDYYYYLGDMPKLRELELEYPMEFREWLKTLPQTDLEAAE